MASFSRMVIQSNPEHLPQPQQRSFSRNSSKRRRRSNLTSIAPASPRIDDSGDCSFPDAPSIDDWQAPIFSLSNDTFFTYVFDDESDEEDALVAAWLEAGEPLLLSSPTLSDCSSAFATSAEWGG